MKDLEELGGRLGLSREDVEVLKKERRKWRLILWITGIASALILFFLGFLIGWFASKETGGGGADGYPYAVSAAGFVSPSGIRINKFQLLLLPVLGFFAGLSGPVFGQSVRYGVYDGGST